jgi:hypothetical protein
MLRQLALTRLRGGKNLIPAVNQMLRQPVVRPFDILADGSRPEGAFRLSRWYPGHLPECLPDIGDGEDGPPHAAPPGSRPGDRNVVPNH